MSIFSFALVGYNGPAMTALPIDLDAFADAPVAREPFAYAMVPHFVRLIVGGDNVRVVPLRATFGALTLIWADIVARMIMAPEDMPIGIVTGLVGGVAFILILRKGRGVD